MSDEKQSKFTVPRPARDPTRISYVSGDIEGNLKKLEGKQEEVITLQRHAKESAPDKTALFQSQLKLPSLGADGPGMGYRQDQGASKVIARWTEPTFVQQICGKNSGAAQDSSTTHGKRKYREDDFISSGDTRSYLPKSHSTTFYSSDIYNRYNGIGEGPTASLFDSRMRIRSLLRQLNSVQSGANKNEGGGRQMGRTYVSEEEK